MLDGLEREGLVEKGVVRERRARHLRRADRRRAARSSRRARCSHVAAICALFEERFSPDELATLTELLSRLPGATPPACEAS